MDPNSATAAAGLPKMSDIYSNVQAPTLSDIGGSLGDKATGINQVPSNAFQQYSNFAGSLRNPYDTYQNLLAQHGIPQLQQTSQTLQGNINDLEEQMNRVLPDVTANTGNSLVTESQRNGMVEAKKVPLQLAESPLVYGLGQVNNSLATQEQNIGNEVNAMNVGNQQQLDVGALGVNVAQDNAARTMTGFTTDAQNIMQGLLKKMDIVGTLDAAEWDTLSKLAIQKQSYDQQLGVIAAQQKYQTLPAGGTLINTQTGQKTTGGSGVTPTLSTATRPGGNTGITSTANNRPALNSFIINNNSVPNNALNLSFAPSNTNSPSASFR